MARVQGEVEQIAMMKPKGQTEHDEGMLEYLEDIIGSCRLKEPIHTLSRRIELLNEQRGEKVTRHHTPDAPLPPDLMSSEHNLNFKRLFVHMFQRYKYKIVFLLFICICINLWERSEYGPYTFKDSYKWRNPSGTAQQMLP